MKELIIMIGCNKLALMLPLFNYHALEYLHFKTNICIKSETVFNER